MISAQGYESKLENSKASPAAFSKDIRASATTGMSGYNTGNNFQANVSPPPMFKSQAATSFATEKRKTGYKLENNFGQQQMQNQTQNVAGIAAGAQATAKKHRKVKPRELKTLDKHDVVGYTNKQDISNCSPKTKKFRNNSKRYDKPSTVANRHTEPGHHGAQQQQEEFLPDISQGHAYQDMKKHKQIKMRRPTSRDKSTDKRGNNADFGVIAEPRDYIQRNSQAPLEAAVGRNHHMPVMQNTQASGAFKSRKTHQMDSLSTLSDRQFKQI